ncbi:hypothetical protein [uncultured Maribacter sp.]|uniref:hypothetical protein n=1 Tax=uncultured Maribacter sp. TaxID=431308 RepID=UPI0026208240|nr:hypothetical protein [uncultured Maribacter sp.]
MNGIIRLKHVTDYQKVCYYSVIIDKDDEPIETANSLFENFVKQQTIDNLEKLNHILSWLAEIGNRYGAQDRYFRDEQNQGEAMGLPPYAMGRPPVYTEDGKTAPNNLRLYCHRLNPNVVILFNGGVKTEALAQECPNVKTHFLLANQLTKIIDQAFQNKDIKWINEDTDIDYDNNLILYY